MATKKQTPAPVPALPARLVFTRPHSFIDAAGVHRQWLPGHVVVDPDDIAMLIARKAPVEPH
jgi:hypothetical protein